LRDLLPGDVFVAFILTRLALLSAGLIAPLFLARTSLNGDVGPAALAMWTRWDGQIYIAIAQHGYFLRERSPLTAFFPLYPFLMQVLTLGSKDPVVLAIAGVLISNLSLLVMLAYIVALGRLDFDDGVGRRAAVYYLVAPTTLFLSAVYAEPLFMALMLASFYHARRGQFAVAGALAFFCGLARPYGALLAVPLAWEAIRRKRLPVAALAALLGPLTYFGWLWLQFGDPLLWLKAQGAWPWQRHIDVPWHGFLNYVHGTYGWFDPEALARIDLVAAVALVVATLLALWRLPRIYGVFAAITTLLLLMATHFQSMTRWTLTVFPIVFLLALWGRDRRINYGIIGLSFAVALYLMARFSQWLWVA
jgi:Gpi18-like mannosyltransferase